MGLCLAINRVLDHPTSHIMTDKTLAQTAEIEAMISRFIREQLTNDKSMEIDPEENLLMSGTVDSVGLVRLVAHLKEQLEITIPAGDLVPKNFRSVRVMGDYIAGLLDA